MPRTIRFRCWGHQNLRATHGKTLEFTREAEISRRGTCIVGVAATFEPQEAARLRGTLTVKLLLGEDADQFQAVANPFMAASESLVFRRSGERFGNTFASESEKSARDLDRRLAAKLVDPLAEMEVCLEESSGSTVPGALMLLAESPRENPSAAAQGFLKATDILATPATKAPLSLVRSLGSPAEHLPCRRPSDGSRLLRRLASGKRIILTVRVEDLERGSPTLEVIRSAGEEGIPLTCIGAAPRWLRALALSGLPGVPFALREEVLASGSWRQDLASPALGRGSLILPCSGTDLPARLSAAAEAGRSKVFVVRDPGDRREETWWGDPAHLCETLRNQRWTPTPWFLVVGPQENLGGAEEVGVSRDFLHRLLEAGVSLKTIAHATQADFGGSYRKAYKFLLDLQKTASEIPGSKDS